MSGPTAPAAPAAPASPTSPDNSGGLPPVEGLFPHVIAPEVDNSAPSPEETPQTVSPEQFESLQSTFNTFREEAKEREARLTETIQTLMMRPAGYAPQAPAPAQPQGFDLSDLPDPVENPKAYNTALQSKLSGYLEHQTQSSQQQLLSQVTSAQAINGVWSRLQGQYPELAKRQILLQGAAAAEFGQLRAQGIDPVAVAAQNPDGLVANIVNRMNAELGVAPSATPSAPAGINPGGARAASIAGGSQPTAPAAPARPAQKSFVDQLKATQMADGLI